MLFFEKIFNFPLFRKTLYIISMVLQIGKLKKKFYQNPDSLKRILDSYKDNETAITLDLGSGPEPRNPFNAGTVYGTDLRANEKNNVIFADFSTMLLPFHNEMFDYITSYDVLEHVPRLVFENGKTIFPFIQLLNEIFRILKPGGIFFSIQPCYPTKQAFQDPTHVNIMTEDTMYLYFCEPAWARIYGYEGSFKLIRDGWLGDKYFSFMQKSAVEPIKQLDFIQKKQ